MFEDITYEDILDRILNRVDSKYDKREGSIIYDAIAPAAAEIKSIYDTIDIVLKESFGDTADREYLVRRAAERGVIPESATHAILKGIFTPSGVEIPVGTRFSCNDLDYYITEKISDGNYKLACETAGTVGNSVFGTLIPISNVAGLVTAELTELLIPGEDEEDTEVFRQRYFDSFDTKAYGGNRKDYIQKTNSISGVGGTKVTPVWNGGGTVLLTIIDSNYNTASDALVSTVQELMDPEPQGQGLGIAPIDHIVTVKSATGVKVNVSAVFTFDEGYSISNLNSAMTEALNNYLLELRKEWADHTQTIVRISQIETRLLKIDGIIDIQKTKVNGSENNLTLDKYSVPVTGEVSNGT